MGGIAQANEIEPGRSVDSRNVEGARGSKRTQSFRALGIPGHGLSLAGASVRKYAQGQAEQPRQHQAGFGSNAHPVVGTRQRRIRP